MNKTYANTLIEIKMKEKSISLWFITTNCWSSIQMTKAWIQVAQKLNLVVIEVQMTVIWTLKTVSYLVSKNLITKHRGVSSPVGKMNTRMYSSRMRTVFPGGGVCLGVCGRDPLPVNRITDRCKNITLPQLRCGR